MSAPQLANRIEEARSKLKELRVFARANGALADRTRASLVQAAALFRRLDALIDTETDRLYAPLREDRLRALDRRQSASYDTPGDGGPAMERVDFTHLPQGKRNDLEDAAHYFSNRDSTRAEADSAAAHAAKRRVRHRSG